MKIYFGASVTGKKYYLENYLKIVECLRNIGHETLTYDFFKTSVEKVKNQSKEEKIEIHNQLGKLKAESDIIVMECSYSSFALGQEIGHAFRMGKPVLALHIKDHEPHLILSDAGDKLLILEYDLSNLEEKIHEGLEFLNPREQKRFTLNMPAELVDYLDRTSRQQNITRSDIIRELITGKMLKERSKKV